MIKIKNYLMTNYKKLKQKTYIKYKKIRQVYCPYFKTKVRFKSKGFWHMIYTGRNQKRELKSQKLRFKLLALAVKTLHLSATLQEFENNNKTKALYYGFIAIIEGWKIKVIVKKAGHGRPYFWSVIPNWITNKKRDRVLFKGNLEKD